MLENWYPTAEEGDKKGVMVVVTAGKEGAVSGGKSFMQVRYRTAHLAYQGVGAAPSGGGQCALGLMGSWERAKSMHVHANVHT